jgi:hypothetical protein
VQNFLFMERPEPLGDVNKSFPNFALRKFGSALWVILSHLKKISAWSEFHDDAKGRGWLVIKRFLKSDNILAIVRC